QLYITGSGAGGALVYICRGRSAAEAPMVQAADRSAAIARRARMLFSPWSCLDPTSGAVRSTDGEELRLFRDHVAASPLFRGSQGVSTSMAVVANRHWKKSPIVIGRSGSTSARFHQPPPSAANSATVSA